MKQGEEKTEFVKEAGNNTDKFIFQKNKKTKVGAIIVIAFLILMIIGVIVSGVVF